MGIPDEFIEHGARDELFDLAGISARHISEKVLGLL
jgi:deoxyxylulose-5-phosphate synthase